MNETREQWIEREASAARTRWGASGNWGELSEIYRADWRRVVAPYCPEPVADAKTLRDLREIALKAYLAHPQAKGEGCMVDPMEAAVIAVLMAAKPEPVDDVETLGKLAAIGENAYNANKSNLLDDKWISATKAILRAAKPEPVRVPVDVDGLAEAIRDAYYCASKGWAGCARAALAFLNIEPCAKPEYNPDDVALTANERAELENLRVECKRLRQWQVRVQQAINLPEVPK